MNAKEIMEIQNQIAVEEFKRNYNKSEAQRVAEELIFGKDSKVIELEKSLQNSLKDNYEVNVSSCGYITVYEKIDDITKRLVKTVAPTIRTPYAYAMGKAVSKKSMREFIEYYNL